MRFTKRIQDLPTNRNGERQLEPHHLDDNFAAQDDALLTGFRALFATGGVAVPGIVTLTDTSLRVQGRVGVTLDGTVPVHVEDQTLALAGLAAGKGLVVMTTDPVTIQRVYTDVVTGQNLTDPMNVSAGQLAVIGAGAQGVALDSDGYPVAPSTTIPVGRVTRTGDGVTLDRVDNPQMTVRASVASADGVSVVGASITGGHLILHLSRGPDIDAGALPGAGSTGLPAGGPTSSRPAAAGHDYATYFDTTLLRLLTAYNGHWYSQGQAVDSPAGLSNVVFELPFAEGAGATTDDVGANVVRNIAGGSWVAGGLHLEAGAYVALDSLSPTAFTVLAVVRRNVVGNDSAILGGPDGGLAFRFGASNQLQLMRNQLANLATGTASYTSTDDWIFVAVTFDANAATFYNSGGADGSSVIGGQPFSTGLAYIGATYSRGSNGLGEFLRADIAYAALTSTAMTAAQVAATYIRLRDKLLAERAITVT